MVARERRETMQGVCGELERCRTPNDQDVVEVLIKKLLSKLPGDFVEKGHEKTLHAKGALRAESCPLVQGALRAEADRGEAGGARWASAWGTQ